MGKLKQNKDPSSKAPKKISSLARALSLLHSPCPFLSIQPPPLSLLSLSSLPPPWGGVIERERGNTFYREHILHRRDREGKREGGPLKEQKGEEGEERF
jgi:hypothetical protein